MPDPTSKAAFDSDSLEEVAMRVRRAEVEVVLAQQLPGEESHVVMGAVVRPDDLAPDVQDEDGVAAHFSTKCTLLKSGKKAGAWSSKLY